MIAYLPRWPTSRFRSRPRRSNISTVPHGLPCDRRPGIAWPFAYGASRCCYRGVSPHRHGRWAVIMRKKQHNLSNRCLILGAGWSMIWKVDTGVPGYARTIDRQQQDSSFGDHPTTSSAKRRCGRDGPGAGIRQAFPRSKPPRAICSGGLVWRHALSLFGDIKYPDGFKRFDYVNPDAPKGGLVRQLEIGTFDNFNHGDCRAEGIDRERRRADLSGADHPIARRSLDRRMACWRRLSLSRRFFLRNLPAASGGAMARRQTGDAGRRDLLVRCAEEETARCTAPITATSSSARRSASAT